MKINITKVKSLTKADESSIKGGGQGRSCRRGGYCNYSYKNQAMNECGNLTGCYGIARPQETTEKS